MSRKKGEVDKVQRIVQRTVIIKDNEKFKSEWRESVTGVPKGSILGPLLNLLYRVVQRKCYNKVIFSFLLCCVHQEEELSGRNSSFQLNEQYSVYPFQTGLEPRDALIINPIKKCIMISNILFANICKLRKL